MVMWQCFRTECSGKISGHRSPSVEVYPHEGMWQIFSQGMHLYRIAILRVRGVQVQLGHAENPIRREFSHLESRDNTFLSRFWRGLKEKSYIKYLKCAGKITQSANACHGE